MEGYMPGYDRKSTRHGILIASADGMLSDLRRELQGVEF